MASSNDKIKNPVSLGRESLQRFDLSSRCEWLETNGLGSFASGTVSGVHTRRYHGLLCAALSPPLGRMLLLSKFDETAVIAGREVALDTNIYKETTRHPEGYQLYTDFRLNPWPTWSADLQGAILRREVIMLHGRQGVLLRYTLLDDPDGMNDGSGLLLKLRPLFAWRDYHAIERETPERETVIRQKEAGTPLPGSPPPGSAAWYACPAGELELIEPLREQPEVHILTSSEACYAPDPFWYYDFSYEIEAYRGDPTREDLHSPGEFYVEMERGVALYVWVGSSPTDYPVSAADEEIDWDRLVEAERERRADLAAVGTDFPGAGRLARAADQFIVRRDSGLSSIIAGYPWFTDWGRDTMISLPGLALTTGRHAEARDMLLTFAKHAKDGLIPNRFPDEGDTPQYNTVDATLWMYEATARYIEATGDQAILAEGGLLDFFCDSVEHHLNGTQYNIKVDPADGLISAGSPGTQLTWMDAKYEDEVYTPRHGKPVEINGLWINGLTHLAGWLGEAGKDSKADEITELRDRALASFDAKFWYEEGGHFYDVIDGDGGKKDTLFRPNQIIALSLPHLPVAEERLQSVVAKTRELLLTPYGLRSLAAGLPKYAPKYGGDRPTRDSQYHNGTVWGWLIGPFIDAWMRASSGADKETAREQAAEWLKPLLQSLETDGLGQIAEIFDAEAPFASRGCFAQAWSIAELLRVIVRYDLGPLLGSPAPESRG